MSISLAPSVQFAAKGKVIIDSSFTNDSRQDMVQARLAVLQKIKPEFSDIEDLTVTFAIEGQKQGALCSPIPVATLQLGDQRAKVEYIKNKGFIGFLGNVVDKAQQLAQIVGSLKEIHGK